jgi:hypothetical protein
MADAPSIDTIRANRDAALAALDAAYNAVGSALEQATAPGPIQKALNTRYDALDAQRTKIITAATDQVLGSASVIAAVAQLGTLCTEMTTVAEALPGATDVLKATAPVLALGQKVAGLFGKA